MIDKNDDIRGLDLVWVDSMERAAIKWLDNDTVLISPVETGEVTVQRTIGPNGERELTVISERTAKLAMRDILADFRNKKEVEKLIALLNEQENEK